MKPIKKQTKKSKITTHTVKGYEPTTLYQRVATDNLFETINLDPAYVPWAYVSNIIQRVFARTYGQGPYGPVPIKCNEEGSLYVAGLGGAYTRNETKVGSATDSYLATPISFSEKMGRIDIFTFDNKMKFKRSRDGVTWDDEITLFQDSFYSIDCQTLQFNIKNETAGSVAKYQVIGWF